MFTKARFLNQGREQLLTQSQAFATQPLLLPGVKRYNDAQMVSGAYDRAYAALRRFFDTWTPAAAVERLSAF